MLDTAKDDSLLDRAEITAWDWTASKGGNVVTGSSTGVSPSVSECGNLQIDGINILLPPDSSLYLTNDIVPDPGFSFSQKIVWSRMDDMGMESIQYMAEKPTAGTSPLWNSWPTTLGGNPWVIATVVPEPSSLNLLTIAILG